MPETTSTSSPSSSRRSSSRGGTQLFRAADVPGLSLAVSVEDAAGRPRHRHGSLVLGLVTEGARRIETPSGSVRVDAGEGFCIAPGRIHACGADQGRCAFLAFNLELRAADAPGLAAAPLHWRDAELAQALRLLAGCVMQPEAPAPQSGPELLAQALALLAALPAAPSADAGAVPEPVRQAAALLAASEGRAVPLRELAEACGLGPYALHRAFVRALGLPPHAWILQRRLDEAKALLRAGLPPAEAALLAGFCDQSHLNRQFLRLVGVSPGQYAAAHGPARP